MRIEKTLTKDILYTKTSPEDIFRQYFGEFRLGKAYNSILRSDKSPSVSFYYPKSGGELRMKDFSTGQSWTALSFIQELYQISFGKALQKVWDEMGLSTQLVAKSVQNGLKEAKKETLIQIIPKAYTEHDLNFWKLYGIEQLETLKLYNILSVRKLWVNKKPFTLKKDELCFCYYFPKSGHCKIYRPLSGKSLKWLSNTDNLKDIQGYYPAKIKETKPNLLILTKSMKEILFLRERGIIAMATNGENHSIDKDFIRHIKKYCSCVRSLYDKDESGAKGTKYLLDNYQIEPIEFPKQLTFKDLTDNYAFGDKHQVQKFVEEIISLKKE